MNPAREDNLLRAPSAPQPPEAAATPLRPFLVSYLPSAVKTAIRRGLGWCGIQPFLNWRGIRQPWKTDLEFLALQREIIGRTTLGTVGAWLLFHFAQQVRDVPGQVAELGVYRGGSAKVLCAAVRGTEKTVHLFDTFTGHPPPDPRYDRHRRGNLSDTSLADVRAYLNGEGAARFYPGLFPSTLTPLVPDRFCFVHIHADLYASVRAGCEVFFPRISPGGIVFFSDYGSAPGAHRAVQEFFATHRRQPVYLGTGQGFVTREYERIP